MDFVTNVSLKAEKILVTNTLLMHKILTLDTQTFDLWPDMMQSSVQKSVCGQFKTVSNNIYHGKFHQMLLNVLLNVRRQTSDVVECEGVTIAIIGGNFSVLFFHCTTSVIQSTLKFTYHDVCHIIILRNLYNVKNCLCTELC